jgi:erythromycin esterase-like protein
MRLHSTMRESAELVAALRHDAIPLTGEPADYEPLLEAIGDARLVLIGEASHGTHEFYARRAELTRLLIAERGFHAVALEADWPDALRVSRYVQGADDDADAEAALRGFERFPTWMWRNAEVLDFVGWLRAHNDRAGEPVGFYGLDLYSLYRSIEAVVGYLDEIDPAAAERARARYECLERFEEEQRYGRAVAAGVTEACDRQALHALLDLQRAGDAHLRRDGFAAEDEQFYAEENARLVIDAERYYRTMFGPPASSWNLRDSHMFDALERLIDHLDSRVGQSRVVVWAHNSHVGDARRTEMTHRGEHNIGQLVKERHGEDSFVLGFTTHEGTVSAASGWGGDVERKRVRPSLPESFEAAFHESGVGDFVLPLTRGGRAAGLLSAPRLERAIGVIYRPETERASHYFAADLAMQFDAVMHIDVTRAVEPLEPTAHWVRGEPPETYPTAL